MMMMMMMMMMMIRMVTTMKIIVRPSPFKKCVLPGKLLRLPCTIKLLSSRRKVIDRLFQYSYGDIPSRCQIGVFLQRI